VRPEASYLWSHGADHGAFAGIAVDKYTKDLPVSRLSSDVLIALQLNDKPLRAENGFPARLVVPGFYGTNSVKWLTRITLADRRADSPFTTRWYNDDEVDREGRITGRKVPVWEIAPECVIVSPAPAECLSLGKNYSIWGRAWADGGVKRVRVSVDDGLSWRMAELEPQVERSWQRFSLSWTPNEVGSLRLSALASGNDGSEQPLSGFRNAAHSVGVTVR
jgi:DMSO/TMAO reductase YedYZ molybdopterin-dependent catalytic subunit